jgi:DNA-directed RNA polymerase III subunit RPC6
MEMILNTLVYDGKIERILSGDGNNLYRTIQPLVKSTGLIKTTCGLCPVRI